MFLSTDSEGNGSSFRFIDLFAGIGGIRLAFEAVGGTCVFSSEWDESCQNTYEANFGERPFGDITQILPADIPDHDILLGGFPCQAFSIMGDMKGFEDTRGTLFFSIEAILQTKQPSAFLLENVKQLRTHDRGRTFRVIMDHLDRLGYHTYDTVLNALDFGLPQKRERTFIVGFRDSLHFDWPKSTGVEPTLESILEPDEQVSPDMLASDRIRESRYSKCKIEPFFPSVWHENKAGNVSVLPYSCALRTNASYNYLLVNGVRRPTSRELLRLQGFPDEFKIVVPHSEVRKQTGNSVAVSVVRAVAIQITKSLNARIPAVAKYSQPSLFSEEPNDEYCIRQDSTRYCYQKGQSPPIQTYSDR